MASTVRKLERPAVALRSRGLLRSSTGRLLAAALLVVILPFASCRGLGPSGGADPPPSGSLSFAAGDALRWMWAPRAS